MNVEVRGETVHISGYVNAVERYSKPITDSLRGKVQTFIERIRAGAFHNALRRNEVKVLLNHDNDRELATTKDGSAKLEEDNIGLRADVVITDKEVVEKAKNGQLVGWSFGFYSNADDVGEEKGVVTRTVTDLDLAEVSILDDTRSPAYYGTSIETRSKGEKQMAIREETLDTEEKTEEMTTEVDLEELVELVVKKVVEALKTETKAEENAEAGETEGEPEAEKEKAETEETKTAEEKPAEEEKTEERAIDYSDFENRIANL